MALDSLWYYSRENQKRGPVTSSEIHRLAQRKKIAPEDLVWCDGMEKWVPARTIRGMFPEDDDGGLLTDMFEGPQAKELETPREDSERDYPPSLDQVSDFGLNDQPLEQAGRYGIEFARKYGRTLIAIGFLSLILLQGCETAGTRNVQRVESNFDLEQQKFSDRFDPQIAGIESEMYQLQGLPALKLDQQNRLSERNQALNTLRAERAAELARLESGSWSKLRLSVHESRANFSVWSYYRQILVVAMSLTLAIGLFGRFHAGQPAERWLAIALLSMLSACFLLGQFFQSGVSS